MEVIEPPVEDGDLPAATFFDGLAWDTLRTIKGDTFVQVPKRFEQAYVDDQHALFHAQT